MTTILRPLVGFLMGLALLWPATQLDAQQGQLEKEKLEAVEDLSESLANDLLELSLATRDKDLRAIAEFFEDPIVAHPLPVKPEPLIPVVKWIHQHAWWLEVSKAKSISRTDFLKSFEALLEHFSEIEDARFKVKDAHFDEGRSTEGTAKVSFFIIGRDLEGRREWLTGRGSIEAMILGKGPWRIRRLHLEAMESKVATKDLFSEVALPAQVSAVFPPFGTPPNEGFVAHGAAAGDVNGDGLLDIVATGVQQNSLYLNEGDGRFRDISAESLVKFAPIGSGPLFLDYDNDGDTDLFLAAVGRQVLLENALVPHGELKFWNVSETAKVDLPAVGFSAVAADVNRDGYQDIYVASYNRYGIVMPNSWHRATNGTPNLLFINKGNGSFREEAEAWGVNDSRWSYAAGFADVDGDGDQDLFVANDFGEDALYLNEGKRFRDVAAERGVQDPGFGMGVAFGDYDNDGDLDLHVTNMSSTAGNRILGRLYPDAKPDGLVLKRQAGGNSLYESNGNGTFRDVSAQAGGFSAGWAFGGGFIDFDNDGWEDIYTPNGFISGKSMKDT